MTKTLARLMAVAVLAQAVAVVAPMAAQGQDNTAVAVNKKDGKSVFKLAFSVKKATGTVDASNSAVAYSSCTDCKTVAAAIQVVLVSGPTTSSTPENVAIAVNYQCSECETLAAAYQFVYGNGQELQFTKEGKQRLQELRRRFLELKKRDDLTLDQLAAEIASIAAEVAVVVDTETEAKKTSEIAGPPTTAVTGSPSTTAPSRPPPTTSAPTTTVAAPPTTVTATPTTNRLTTSTTTSP